MLTLAASADSSNTEVRLRLLQMQRRERAIGILSDSGLDHAIVQHFLLKLDERWVLELIELHHDPILPSKHWKEWCFIAMREGERYPYVIRNMQSRRLDPNDPMIRALVAS